MTAAWSIDGSTGITLDKNDHVYNHTGDLTINSTPTITLSNGATFEQSGLINPGNNAIVVKGDGTLKIIYQGTSLCSISKCLSGFDIYNDCVVDNSCVYNSTITDSGNMMLCGTSDLLHFHGNGEVIIGRNTWVRQNCTLTVDSNCNAKFSQSTMDGINTNSGFNLTNYTITFDVAENATLESSVRIFDEGNNRGNIVKTGAGTMTITNSNNIYRGTTTISGGTLVANTSGSIGTGSLTINNATLNAAFQGNIPASSVTIQGNSTFISSVGWNRLKSISGSGALTLIGSGFLAINNSFHARNFTGTFIVGTTTQAGKLSLEVQSNLLNADSGKIKVVNGIVDWRGFEQSFNSLEYLDGEMQNMTGKLTIGNEFKYNSSTDLEVPCTIAGTADLVKKGSGTLTLSQAPQYTGSTTIESGKLVLGTNSTLNNLSGGSESNPVTLDAGTNNLTINNLTADDVKRFIGSITATTITVNATAAEAFQIYTAANGSVSADSFIVSSGRVDVKGYMEAAVKVGSGATFSPGNSVGHVETTEDFTLDGGTLLIEMDETGIDTLTANSFDLANGTISFTLTDDIPWGSSYDILTATSGEEFDETIIDRILNGQTLPDYFSLALAGDTNNIVRFSIDRNAVPEPSTWALLALGVVVLFLRKRK
ncbi:MAG: autotransporter-associated beta strand repeat-containing protein [Thermoguttaceae bacterium]|nr:autotransporter-associated beta strand repeat-containing protein [Thermoguttaceae bacterium]